MTHYYQCLKIKGEESTEKKSETYERVLVKDLQKNSKCFIINNRNANKRFETHEWINTFQNLMNTVFCRENHAKVQFS